MSVTPALPPNRVVLHDFVTRYREDIIARTRAKLGSRPAPVSVPGSLENGVPLFLTQLSETGLTFTLASVSPGLTIEADPHLLGSAVTNLLNNAFKFTHAGGHVVLSASADDTRVYISVEDGCGGLPESQDGPFQAFVERRGEDRTGLGLGLSIARKAVRAHGGDISIRNIPGTGCVFTIDLSITPVSTAGDN